MQFRVPHPGCAAGKNQGETEPRAFIPPPCHLNRVCLQPCHLDRVREWRDPPTNLSAFGFGDGQTRVEARLGIPPLEDSVGMTVGRLIALYVATENVIDDDEAVDFDENRGSKSG